MLHLSDYLILAGIILLIALAVGLIIRRKRKPKGCCGCTGNCSGCSLSGQLGKEHQK